MSMLCRKVSILVSCKEQWQPLQDCHLLLQSLRCRWHLRQLQFGGARGAGIYLGQEGEVRGVLIPGCAVVGTCSPGDVFVLVDKNWVVLLCNAKATGRGVLWCWGCRGMAGESRRFPLSLKHNATGPGGMSEVLLPGSLLRICDGGVTHHFQLVDHSSLPTQPWSLGAMGCQEGVPWAASTTTGYLGSTEGENPGDLWTSLGQGQSQCRDGDGWPRQNHKCRC